MSAMGRKRTFGLSARLGESGRQHEWGSDRRFLPDYAAIFAPVPTFPLHGTTSRCSALPLLEAPNGPITRRAALVRGKLWSVR
jgi:hypothetical protein